MALRWSPEQIAGRAKRDNEPFSISFPTIYRAIDTGILPPQLKKIMRFKWKHKKCKTEDKRGKIPNTTPISQRPAGAKNRTRFGHWESDTVETFAEQWFEEYAKINLRNTSFERMKQLTARVYPAIGHLRLDKITGRHIQQFINDLINSTSERTGRPLARKTVIHHLSFISDVFSYAVKMDMLTYNPCRKVTVPKGEAKEKDIYTIEEITRIFELLDGENVPTKFRVFFKLAVYSGYRRGELLGLEWKDVDFENNTIKVRRTSNYTAKKGIYTDTTKTKKSQRTQKYPQYVMDMLWELRKEQDEQCARMGDKWQDYDRLFIKWDGSPMNNNTPYFWFKEFCEKNSIRFCDIHSLRHLHASLLINAGVDVVAVSGDLGHSQVSTTTNIYCHMFQEAQARTSQAIGRRTYL